MAVGDTSMQNWKVSDPPAFKVGASMASSGRTAEQSLSLYWRESVPWKMADRSHPGVPSSVPRYVAVNWMTTYWPAGGSLKSLAPATMAFPSSPPAAGVTSESPTGAATPSGTASGAGALASSSIGAADSSEPASASLTLSSMLRSTSSMTFTKMSWVTTTRTRASTDVTSPVIARPVPLCVPRRARRSAGMPSPSATTARTAATLLMIGTQLSSNAMIPSTIDAMASPAPFLGGGPAGGP